MRLVSIAFVIFLVQSCKTLDKFTRFNMDYNTSYTYTSGLPINLPVNLSTPDVQTNSESTFAINDTRKDLIESILLKELNLTITAPAGKTFSFLKDVRIYISAEGMAEVEIARLLNIDNTVGGELSLDVFSIELKEYIKAPSFKLRAVSTTDELLTGDVSVNIYSRFFVDAEIAGV